MSRTNSLSWRSELTSTISSRSRKAFQIKDLGTVTASRGLKLLPIEKSKRNAPIYLRIYSTLQRLMKRMKWISESHRELWTLAKPGMSRHTWWMKTLKQMLWGFDSATGSSLHCKTNSKTTLKSEKWSKSCTRCKWSSIKWTCKVNRHLMGNDSQHVETLHTCHTLTHSTRTFSHASNSTTSFPHMTSRSWRWKISVALNPWSKKNTRRWIVATSSFQARRKYTQESSLWTTMMQVWVSSRNKRVIIERHQSRP